MKKTFKVLTIVTTLILANVLFARVSRADLINPDWLDKQCQPGEKEFVCSYSSRKPFGPRTTDHCQVYANNPNYYFLTSHGSSFGGEEKYCFKPGNFSSNSVHPIAPKNYLLIGAGVIALASISLFSLLLIRKKNVH